jgi:CRP-like cAMP-binding protein
MKVWRRGEILVLQGSSSDSMFVILKGWIKVSATNYRGDDAPLAARGPAEIVGEMAPISGLPRTATMQAIGDVHTLVVPRGKLVEVLHQYPRIAEELLRTTAIRLQQSDRLRLETGAGDLSQRLAAVLLELGLQYVRTWPETTAIDLPFNQGELAGFARVSRSTLTRGLDELKRLGAVRAAGSHVTIVNPMILRELAAGRALPPTTT